MPTRCSNGGTLLRCMSPEVAPSDLPTGPEDIRYSGYSRSGWQMRPDGQISPYNVLLSSPFGKNILIFRKAKSPYINSRPAPCEGRCATSRNAERDAVDAGSALDGRLLPADGEVVWS
jgi:hypothetical protein